MKGVFSVFFFAVAAVALGMMFLMGGDEEPVATRAPVLSEIEQRIEGAHSRGATLFQYKVAGVEGIALCNGRSRLIALSTDVKEFRLTSQEALGLTLCKLDLETGTYYSIQDLPGTLPGDFLVWDEGGVLHDTKYTPR